MNALASGFLFALVALPLKSAPPTVDPAATRAQDPEVVAEPEDAALAEVRALLEAARRAQSEKDYPSAREQILAAIETALAQIGQREDVPALTVFEELGRFAHDAGELRAAERAQRAVLAVFTRTLPEHHPDLQGARQNLAVTMCELGDLAGARALFEAVLAVFTRTLPEDHPDLQTARLNLAVAIKAQGDLAGARALEEAVLAVRARTLPEDHPDLQAARQNLAATMAALGDLPAARALFEAVLAVFARTLPDDHPDLQAARSNLAVTIKAQGDLAGARAFEEAVLAVRLRTLPDDHPDLQRARQNLAVTIEAQGDLAGARAFEEAVLAVLSRTLPDDHPDLQAARQNLAVAIKAQGDLAGARALEEAVLAVRSRTLPDDHPDLQAARLNLAGTIKAQGDLAGARALEEAVLAVFTRTLPDDHPDLQGARLNLAATIAAQGDLAGARALEEAVLAVFTRTLPDDHPDLQRARQNLAVTIKAQGDLAGARALEEAVLAVRSRTLPDDHPDLQAARSNLAATIKAQGDLAGARALEEAVLAVFARTLPDDHPDLQRARSNLAGTIKAQGDLAGARALFEAVLAVFTRTLPDDHPDLQRARQNLAVTIKAQGDLAGARALQEAVLAVFTRTLPDDHPDLQTARGNLARTIVWQAARAQGEGGGEGEEEEEKEEEKEGGRKRCAELVGALCQSQVSAAREALLTSSVREAEERCARLAESLAKTLSFAGGYGVFEPLEELGDASFVLSETTRGAALASAAILRRAEGEPDYDRLRKEMRAASDALAALAQRGTTSEEYHRARTRREEAERELVGLAHELLGDELAGLDFDLDVMSTRLGERDAVVGFRRYTRWWIEMDTPSDIVGEDEIGADDGIEAKSVESLCAFVVRRGRAEHVSATPSANLVIVQLGAIDAIDGAVRGWREAIGAGIERGVGVSNGAADEARTRGGELRRLVWDPLVAELGDAERVIVAQDDVLHLVPLDALPLGAVTEDESASQLVGDRWRIETRATLAELLGGPTAHDEGDRGGVLVALGGASFNSEPMELAEADLAVLEEDGSRRDEVAGILRGGAWERGFPPLTYTGLEAREIAALFDEVFAGERAALVLEKRKASRAALEELAPRARFLHVATHGWYASESIAAWGDFEPLDAKSGLGSGLSGEEQVRGMSPMLLCGLALAGANMPEDALGRVPGLVTAEELSTLDLSNCELAVLSACDTNVGERRAGQGVASLQKALQMAGAKSVITSLWKVPDEATRELMLDFYRRLWVEGKPKWRALWEAKMRLRDARDERGEPLYTMRDWAAWVLTGEPE